MHIETSTRITFNPVIDREEILIFEEDNPDWVRSDTTTGVSFTKTDHYYVEYLIKTKGGPK